MFNGEIYNFLELRRELEAQGAVFRSQSDTEVILAAWEAWREDMLPRFNGMWALAIFDTSTRELFLARDRFGIKPLLYAMSPERFVFASEQRALVRSGLIDPSVDLEVARRLLLDAFGIEGSERTLFRQVRRLQAGHCMWLRQGKVGVRRWWRTVDHLPSVPTTEIERVGRLPRAVPGCRGPADAQRCADRDVLVRRLRFIGGDLHHGVARARPGWGRATVPRGAAPSSRRSQAPLNDERPMAEEAAAWAKVEPTFLEIGQADALADLDRILDDLDDVYIRLPSAVWLIYRQAEAKRRDGVARTATGRTS